MCQILFGPARHACPLPLPAGISRRRAEAHHGPRAPRDQPGLRYLRYQLLPPQVKLNHFKKIKQFFYICMSILRIKWLT